MFEESEGLIERIEKILSKNIILNSLDELYENLPLLEYNLSKPNITIILFKLNVFILQN